MPVPLWQPGTLYLPGDLVRPTNTGTVGAATLDNPNFELGAVGWTITGNGNGLITNASGAFDGTWALQLNDTGAGGPKVATNDARLPCVPGQLIIMRCYVLCALSGSDLTRIQPVITWYNASNVVIGHTVLPADPTMVGPHVRIDPTYGLIGIAAVPGWIQLEVPGEAPVGAAFWTAAVRGNWLPDGFWLVDTFTAEYASGEAPNLFVYRAVQPASGFSGGTEPDWPQTLGLQVVDNEVIWECISGNTVTWEAHRILVSGAVEPTWPTGAGASVPDNTIVWTLDSRRVSDENRPSTNMALIAASKIFSPDGDIINFSATVNPLDWSTMDDAGYLPFGLQNYGANPVTAMGLYRSNLIAFNSQGCQVWQVSEDPAAMDLLDAIPVSCVFPRSVCPVGDDLAFLSSLGIRSLGLVGASINLQGGYFGKQVDSLVIPAIEEAEVEGWIPRGLYWPAQGQYWLFFGPQAFVLTINGPRAEHRSWSRYVFPATIDAWTLMGDELHLRAGDLVWRVDADAQLDDEHDVDGDLVGTEFASVIQWPFLDFGSFNMDKEMIGFDLAIDGHCMMSVGYDQREMDFDADGAWTEAHPIDGDSVPGQMIPFSVTGPSFSLRLEFPSTQEWKWYSSNLYIKDERG